MSSNSPTTIQQIIQKLGPLVTSVHGFDEATAGKIAIVGVNSPDLATAEQLAFVTQAKYLEKGLTSSARVIAFPEKMRAAVLERWSDSSRAFFFVKDPEFAMRETVQNFVLQTPYVNREMISGIHPTAVVHPRAKLAAGVIVGPHAVIAQDTIIGESAVIGANSVIEARTTIGARTVIHPLVYVGHSCEIGADCEIHPSSVIGKEGFGYVHDAKNNHYRIPHTGRVVLGDRVHIGANVTVDRGTFGDTRIDSGAILDNRIQIAHNVALGANSILTSGFKVAGSTKIGRNFLAGGGTTVTGHIEICDGVQLGGLSAVRKDITQPGAYAGNPLLPMRDYLRAMAAIGKLPALLKKFRGLLGDDGAAE